MYYRPKNTYSNDPRWINARFESICAHCGKKIKRGDRVFYYPLHKRVFCDGDSCGKHCERDFRNCCEAEDYYATGGRY